jgi:hypothetical protein
MAWYEDMADSEFSQNHGSRELTHIYVSPSYINDDEVGGGDLCGDQLVQGIQRHAGWA